MVVTRSLNDWEVEEYENFLLLLSKVNVTTEKDNLIWKLKKNG